MKAKVWLVIWGLKDGGAETLAREYARLLDPQKFDATLVTMYPFANTANYKRAMDAGLKVISVFKRRNVLTRAVRVLLGKWCIPAALKRMLAKERPDAIHFNSPMARFFASLEQGPAGVRLLYTCHSEVSKHFYDKEEAAVSRLIQTSGLRLIGLHDQMKAELDQRFGVENTVVIRNGVELYRFRNVNSSKEALRKTIDIPSDAYVVGHVGRFSKEKNHAFLLAVFQSIAVRRPNAHLLLVGNGALQDEIEQDIRQRNLDGRVTILSHRTDVPELLHAMDVMVFPSFYEGLSVTLVEAQASGLKCVVSDCINLANYLAPTTIPVSLDAGADAWADIALDDSARNEHYGNIEDYDMGREIHRLERLYQGQQEV